MEIKNTRTPPQSVAFSTLKPGDVFMSGANLCLRTKDQDIVAVALSDGRLVVFTSADEVIPVKAYIVRETCPHGPDRS